MPAPAGTPGTATDGGFGAVGGTAITGGGAGPPAGRAAPELRAGTAAVPGVAGSPAGPGVDAASTAAVLVPPGSFDPAPPCRRARGVSAGMASCCDLAALVAGVLEEASACWVPWVPAWAVVCRSAGRSARAGMGLAALASTDATTALSARQRRTPPSTVTCRSLRDGGRGTVDGSRARPPIDARSRLNDCVGGPVATAVRLQYQMDR